MWKKVNGTECTFFIVPTSTRANVRKQMLPQLLLQPRILRSRMTRVAEQQRLFSSNQGSRQWCVPICAWDYKMLTSFLMRQKPEGQETRGWHKVGFILCFLLNATFRLDQILLLNTTDICHASYGLAIMNMAYTTYSATMHAGKTFWTFLIYSLKVCWTACVLTPHVFKYWIGRAQFYPSKI